MKKCTKCGRTQEPFMPRFSANLCRKCFNDRPPIHVDLNAETWILSSGSSQEEEQYWYDLQGIDT